VRSIRQVMPKHKSASLRDADDADILHSETLIEISHDKDSRIAALGRTLPWLQIHPLFPGAFAISDIMVRPWIAGQPLKLNAASATHVNALRAPSETTPIADTATSASNEDAVEGNSVPGLLSPYLHYARFSPLSPRLGPAAYSREGLHVPIFVGDALDSTDPAALDVELNALLSTLRRLPQVVSLTLVCENLEPVTQAHAMAAALANATNLTVDVTAIRRSNPRDLFALLGKSDAAIFCGSARFVDAIGASVPVYVEGLDLPGIDAINAGIESFANGASAAMVCQQQQQALAGLRQQAIKAGAIDNQYRSLVDAVHEWLSAQSGSLSVSQDQLDKTPTRNVIPIPCDPDNLNMRQRVANAIIIRKRKFTKLRESPLRFAKDSENLLLQWLYRACSR